MSELHLTLAVLPDILAVCRLDPQAAIPAWAVNSRFSSITRTPIELSIVCPQANVPAGIPCEKDWRCLRVQGPLDFSLTGILASLSSALAQASISIFGISTFDTDYILVKQTKLESAIQSLSAAGHLVRR